MREKGQQRTLKDVIWRNERDRKMWAETKKMFGSKEHFKTVIDYVKNDVAFFAEHFVCHADGTPYKLRHYQKQMLEEWKKKPLMGNRHIIHGRTRRSLQK